MARSLASGQGFTFNGRPTAYRPPLYPIILAPTVCLGAWQPWGIALLHLGLGAGTVRMTAAAASGFGWSRRQTLMAAAIAACDPVLVWQARSVMTETPAAFLVAASLAALARPGRRGAVLGGAGFGLAALCRPVCWRPPDSRSSHDYSRRRGRPESGYGKRARSPWRWRWCCRHG
jgi:4-amino-4-deoxy-L-arabinose transferase-like glycosyltransferase